MHKLYIYCNLLPLLFYYIHFLRENLTSISFYLLPKLSRMKKIYVLTVVCLAFVTGVSAQTTYYWIGAAGGNWNSASNWSLTSGGSAAADYPQLATDKAIFDADGTPNLNLSVSINSLTVSNNASVKITGVGGTTQTITVNSTNAAAPALAIAAGAKLEMDAVTNSESVISFAANSQGAINGEWVLSGDVDSPSWGYFTLPSSGASTRVIIKTGGKLTVGPTSSIYPDEYNVADNFLVFQSGSTLEFQGENPIVPSANYDAASTILVKGLIMSGLSFEETSAIGNLTIDCPSLQQDNYLSLYNININGNLLIQNTNGKVLSLVSGALLGGTVTSINVGINGDFTISGNSAVAEVSRFADVTTNVTVQGDFTAGGASFDLNSDNISNLPTNLIVKKAFHHTAGTFGASSTAIDQNQNLFNVEFNGSVLQDVSSVTGSIDNAGNQVTMRMNNALGVSLSSNLAVGRLDFNTTNKGIIHANANTLTINNTSGNATVVSGYGANAFIEGGVIARRLQSTGTALFPTGVGSKFRKFILTPANSSLNTFSVQLISGSNGGAFSTVTGVSNYYWNVNRTSGSSSATISMDLNGAEAGRTATDTLVAAQYDGTSWQDARETDNYIFPGNSASGTVTTSVQSSFNAFTIGYIINAALPIKLVSFTGRKVQNTAELAWEITENSTPAKFEVVKSTDGKNFVSLGSLAGAEGKLKYSLTDNLLAAGNTYYRLKMYDIDGAITYSNIIVVMNGSKGTVISAMMPTVVADRSRLSVSSSVRGNLLLVVTDISGRVVKNQLVSIDAGSQDVWLEVSSLSKGMFQVTGYINGEKTATYRFIKQ